jgi:hypothetical protein
MGERMQIREAKRLVLIAIQRDDRATVKEINACMRDVPGWGRAVDRSALLWRAWSQLLCRHLLALREEVATLKERIDKHEALFQRHEAQIQKLKVSQQNIETPDQAPLHVDDEPAFNAGYEAGYDAGYAFGVELATTRICRPGEN